MDDPPSELELMKQLSDKEKHLQDVIHERDAVISTLKLKVDTQQQEIEKKDVELKELQEQLRSQEAQIQSIEQRMSRILLQVSKNDLFLCTSSLSITVRSMIPTCTYKYVLSINGGYFILQGDIPSLEVKELQVDVKRVKV